MIIHRAKGVWGYASAGGNEVAQGVWGYAVPRQAHSLIWVARMHGHAVHCVGAGAPAAPAENIELSADAKRPAF